MFGFTFLFSPTFFWGGMSCALGGEHPGTDGGDRGWGNVSLWSPASGLDFTPWAPFPSPLPLGAAGRAKQRKGLTRKEEAGGLRTWGAAPPSTALSQGEWGGDAGAGPAGPQAPQRGVRFKRKKNFFNQKRERRKRNRGV